MVAGEGFADTGGLRLPFPRDSVSPTAPCCGPEGTCLSDGDAQHLGLACLFLQRLLDLEPKPSHSLGSIVNVLALLHEIIHRDL